MGDSMLTKAGASDGFWGSVGSALSDLGVQAAGSFTNSLSGSVGQVANNLGTEAGSQLSSWAASQLGLDTSSGASAGINNPIDTSLGNVGPTKLWDNVQVQESGVFEGLEKETVIAGGIVIIALIIVFKFVL